MGAFLFLVFLVLSVAAIMGGHGAQRKLINLLIIVAFMLVGIAVGIALGAWGGNMAIGGHVAASAMILLGAVGALGCIRRNKK